MSEAGRSEMERLYEFSNQLLMEENLHDVARHAPRVVASIFAFEQSPCISRRTTPLTLPIRVVFGLPDELRAAARLPDAPSRGAMECVSFPWCWACAPVDRSP